MLVEEAVNRIKAAGRGTGQDWGVDRAIDFLNTAIQQISSLLAANRYPPIVKTIQLADGDSLPSNYLFSCGNYPIRITDGEVDFLDDELTEIRFRYFAAPDKVVKTADSMPFSNDAINEVVVKGAILLALNENGKQIAQDSQLVAALQQAVTMGLAGVQTAPTEK
jgi:hypothetical protein